MRLRDFGLSAQVYIVSVCCLAAFISAVAAWQPATPASWQLFGLLLVAATIAHSFPVSTPGKLAYHVSLPFLVTGMILLAPLQVVALVVAVHIGEVLRRRRSTTAQVFNTAAYTVSALIAQATYRALWPAQPDIAVDLGQPTCLAAGVAAAAVFMVLNRALVSLVIWLVNGLSWRSQHILELEGLVTDGVLLLMGLPLAHLAQIAPWAAAAGAAPLLLIYRVLDLPNIRAQSRQDGLTELFTAPYLTETATRELNRGRRFNRPVSLLLLDVDGLGELNAAHGQHAGDAVLRRFARTISQALREYDLPARLAGGLFAVLLPETDLAQAQAVAERIRRATAERQHEIPSSVEQATVTLSVGGATVNGQYATAAQVFDAARTALTRSKQAGGNQVSFEAVQAALLTAVPAADASSVDSEPAQHPSARQACATRSAASRWLHEHRHAAAVCVLAVLGLAACIVGAIAALDWAMLSVMLGLSALAGFAFYFKSLPLALAIAGELNRSPAKSMVRRHWRMWPQYAALLITGLLIAHAYQQAGFNAAIAILGAAFIVRKLAGRYVDRTLESVRKLRATNEALQHRAFHDPLTGVANRALFSERLEHALVRAGEGAVAVLFLDLDNFKTVNDTLGHAAGDALLAAATTRLLQCTRREDTIARLGGDEFTVLLEDMRDPSDAARMAERISAALSTPFELDGQQVEVSSSIGIALDTDRSHGPDDLLREADLAMYRAKSAGKARYEIFDPDMAERALVRLELETDLRQAVERGELELLYRPIVSLSSGDVAAVEAQVHWRHPRRGVLPLAEFQRVAEKSGISREIGRWALRQACRDARQWAREGHTLVIQVDMSVRQLEQPDLIDRVRAALHDAAVAPEYLRLEIAESTVALDHAGVAQAMEHLRSLGVRLALDDVGAGPSSLAWFGSLPVDALKLHNSVLASGSAGVIRAAAAVGVALGMNITAQGVEHADEAARLKALGCTHAQGALYGPALSVTHVGALLGTPRTRVA